MYYDFPQRKYQCLTTVPADPQDAAPVVVNFREKLQFRFTIFIPIMADHNAPTPSCVAQYFNIILDYLGIVTGRELNIKTNGSQIVSQLWVNIPVQQQPLKLGQSAN